MRMRKGKFLIFCMGRLRVIANYRNKIQQNTAMKYHKSLYLYLTKHSLRGYNIL